MIQLKAVVNIGRYKDTETGKQYNIKKGKRVNRGTDHIFYYYRGKRVFINDNIFYSDRFKKIE